MKNEIKKELKNIKRLSEVLQFSLDRVCEESYAVQMEELKTAAVDFERFQEDELIYIKDSLMWLQHLIIDKNSGAISIDNEYR